MDAERDEGSRAGDGEREPTREEQALIDAIQRLATATDVLEPAPGRIGKDELARFGEKLDRIAAAHSAAGSEHGAESNMISMYVRCAAIAIAAGDEATAKRWLSEAERFADDEATRAMLAAGSEQPEQLRAIAHGRVLFRLGKERAARKLWKTVAKTGHAALAEVATAELKAPRPLNGDFPSLWTFNGCGLRFAGRRDPWPDRSYATTHCITALYIPIFPLKAYRVAVSGGGWIIMAREQLSGFARAMRYALVGVLALAIAGGALVSYLRDPDRLARQRFESTLADVEGMAPEAAIRQLDQLLAGEERHLAGERRVQAAGAAVIRLTASLAPKPFKPTDADHANRLVQRYRGLPLEAQGGAAREAVVEAIDGWVTQLGSGPETAGARLSLLRLGAGLGGQRAGRLEARLAETRITVADARAEEWPLEALAVLAEQLQAAAMDRATKIVARLVESPSLLVEAGYDLDKWLAVAPPGDPLRQRVVAQLEAAIAAKQEVAAEEITPEQLTALEKARPWDQHVQIRLARLQIDAGKIEDAVARLGKLGPHGMIVREGRLLLAQLSSALGKLEQADALLTNLLEGRLERFLAASSAMQQAMKAAWERAQSDLQANIVPDSLRRKHEAASTDAERTEIVQTWMSETVSNDSRVMKARETYLAVSDVVEISIAAGTVKLRRAQALSGAARDAMLGEAERTFLAIRTEAEGQPEFELGLGEIYARLGKTKESDAAFDAVLAKKDPALSYRVASTYRLLGSVERATRVAATIFNEQRDPAISKQAAALLGLIAEDRDDDDEAEGWYRKADPIDPNVRAALLTLEANRLERHGKRAECAAKHAAAARVYLDSGHRNYNNEAASHARRYSCSGELSAITEALAALEQAYREAPENPLIVGNLAGMHEVNAVLRVLAKQVDLRAARFTSGEAMGVLALLRDGPERVAIQAALAADRGMQRSTELMKQFEVLAPNRVTPYSHMFEVAVSRRDEAAAAAVLERVRRAKALDTSEVTRARKESESGAMDGKRIEELASMIARFDEALGQRLDARTRAVVLMFGAGARAALGLHKQDGAMISRARAAALEAATLWPALDATNLVAQTLIDEAGVAADAATWLAQRRGRTAVAALAKLAAEGSPIAAAIRSSTRWSELPAHLKADTTRPGIDDLRLARLVGDPELEARAKAVLDNTLVRMRNELTLLLDPGNPVAIENLAYLDKR